MNKELIPKHLQQDKYFDFAYERYLKFKKSDQYDEQYKGRTLLIGSVLYALIFYLILVVIYPFFYGLFE